MRGRPKAYGRPSDGWGYGGFSSGPKPPPPTDGIKVGKVGKTWWGERWLAALRVVLDGDDGRLSRGGTYARGGRVSALVVTNGKVTAKVTGSRPTPYKIEVTFTQLAAASWTKVIAELAKRAEYTSELLSGAMPKDIDAAFRAAGTNLFPATRADLKASCSCPDWGDPCKHVAAVHHVLGDAFEKDPFLLFELRGQTRDQVLTALRAARGTTSPPSNISKIEISPEASPTDKPKKSRSKAKAPTPDSTANEPDVAAVPWTKVDPDDYERARTPLPTLHFSFDAPTTHGALLRQLGQPTTWTSDTALADAVSPIVSRAADYARRLALTDTTPEPEDEPPAPSPPKAPPARRKAPGRG